MVGTVHTGASSVADPSYGAVGAPELAIDLVNFVALVGARAPGIEASDEDAVFGPFVEP